VAVFFPLGKDLFSNEREIPRTSAVGPCLISNWIREINHNGINRSYPMGPISLELSMMIVVVLKKRLATHNPSVTTVRD